VWEINGIKAKKKGRQGPDEEAVEIFSNISAIVIGGFLVAASTLATFKCILLAKKYDVLY
jgi:hypothetical protein